MIKYFKTNDEFFKFMKEKASKYHIIKVKPLKRSIRLEYEKKS